MSAIAQSFAMLMLARYFARVYVSANGLGRPGAICGFFGGDWN
jgi:hypothetical protein